MEELSRTQDAVEVNAAADALLVAIERLTLERGLINTALSGDAPICGSRE
jgi:hypothetical protein